MLEIIFSSNLFPCTHISQFVGIKKYTYKQTYNSETGYGDLEKTQREGFYHTKCSISPDRIFPKSVSKNTRHTYKTIRKTNVQK